MRLREVRENGKKTEKIGLGEKWVEHVKFGSLLDSSVETSGMRLIVLIGRALD